MINLKKIILRTFLLFLLLIPIAAIAHFIIFPQQTRCILIGFSGFKKENQLYFNVQTPRQKIDSLQLLIVQASDRVKSFWKAPANAPVIIYCSNKTDFEKYGSDQPVPAVTHLKLGARIVLSDQGADLDIIAHEMTHAALYSRLGFSKYSFKVPRWFDEGLAMQNDYRNYYSEDTLRARSDNYKHLPDVKKMTTGAAFYNGAPGQVMLNFLTARHIVSNWYTKEKLNKLVTAINAGESFTAAFDDGSLSK